MKSESPNIELEKFVKTVLLCDPKDGCPWI